MNPLYDDKKQESILRHARELENSCIEDTLNRYSQYLSEDSYSIEALIQKQDLDFAGKGRFGQYLEKVYFGLKTNNESRPDFEKANLELKIAPLKILKNGGIYRAKERVVLGIIDYSRIAKETFDNSHFLYKNSEILLVFFLYDSLQQLKRVHVNLVDIWRCIQEDGNQIRADWEKIASKVKEGKAHELSEGDTNLLGACTKGSTTLKSMVEQPNSECLARQRALCFKVSYVNYIYQELIRRRDSNERIQFEKRLIPPGTQLTLEQAVDNLISPYIGLETSRIAQLNQWPYNPNDKACFARLIARILGLNRRHRVIHEFSAAGIEVKTVRILANGTIPESMSFKAIDFCSIVDEEWEDSDFYQSIVSRFLIVIFKEYNDGTYHLHAYKFWNMPLEDYKEAQAVWLDTQEKIKQGDYGHFIKQKKPKGHQGVAHVRPHGVKGQRVETPQGTYERPKSFWLDKPYVRDKIVSEFLKA